METVIVLLVSSGMAAGLLLMYLGLRNNKQKTGMFGSVHGALKEDWTPTGKIDFHVTNPSSASPQPMILRVEEMRLIENALGHDVAQLRWRLARLDEAKDVVICWNRALAAELEESSVMGPAVVRLARASA